MRKILFFDFNPRLMITIGFFGTPQLAAQVLGSLLSDSFFDVRFVVSQPDRPSGRHMELGETAVKAVANKAHIPVFQPEKIKNNIDFLDQIRSFAVDYFIVVAYGKILPRELLEIPKKICINIHGSLLPKYRGASPIQASLMAGDGVTGVTIMKMSEGMDEGDIIDTLEIPIDPFETSATLFHKFGMVSGPFLGKTLKKLDAGELSLFPQNHENATSCKKIDKSMGQLDFKKNAAELFHLWRGLTPWPGIWMLYEGKRLVIEKCDFLPEISEFEIGEIIKIRGQIGIQCSPGVLYLQQVKLEGKKSIAILDFINGHPGFVGSKIHT